MLRIEFEYRDAYTNGRWSKQECVMESVSECVRMYGLGVDCEYRIVKVTDLETGEGREARRV